MSNQTDARSPSQADCDSKRCAMTFLPFSLFHHLLHRLSRSCYRLLVSLPLTCIQFLHHTHHIDTRINHLGASLVALTRAPLFIREGYFVARPLLRIGK